MSNFLNLVSIARKARKVEVGEEPSVAAARGHYARLLVVAQDAADNTYRRVRNLGQTGNAVWVSVPFTKSEIGRAVGRESCALLAVTDIGLASAMVKGLAQDDPEKYGRTAAEMEAKAEKSLRRQKEKQQHEKNVRTGKYRGKVTAPAHAPEARDKK